MTPMFSLSFAEILRGAVWQPASQTPAAPSAESRMNWRRFIKRSAAVPAAALPTCRKSCENAVRCPPSTLLRPGRPRSADLGRALSRQTFDFPAVTIRAAQKLICLRDVRDLHRLHIPIERRLWEARCDPAQQHGLGERAGVIEARAGRAFAADGVEELRVMIAVLAARVREALEIFFRQPLWPRGVGQQHHALRADENGADVWEIFHRNERLYVLWRTRFAVVPRHVESFLRREARADRL